MDYEEVRSYLYSLMSYGSSYGIDRMRLLSQKLQNPERKFPTIHVAGTNGKGSVCAMIEAIYRKNGYFTGLFTSPHLVRLEERIQVDRKSISEEKFISYIEYIKRIAESGSYEDEGLRPSFFEMLNAAGFLYFAEKKIDIGIIETGLGGRFDSTNIVESEISVITSISRDHTEILGEDIEFIAMAKAGIIKARKPVVIGLLPVEAEGIIRYIAGERNSPVFSVEEAYGKDLENYPVTLLQGTYQRSNAATAILVSQVLKKYFPINDSIALQALQNVDWPGRWQIKNIGNKKLILDCAHNEEGAKGLAENLEILIQKEGLKPIIIVGVLGLYRARTIMPIISQYAETIILVELKNPKAEGFNALRALIPEDFAGRVVESSIKDLFPFPSVCNVETKGRTIVATGSIYLVGEIMERSNQNVAKAFFR